MKRVYKSEFLDPKQKVQLLQSMSGHKFKSHAEQQNSINSSKFRDKNFAVKSEIDIWSLLKRQSNQTAADRKVSCSRSTVKIISRCHNDDEKLFKSMSNGKFRESPRNSRRMTENVIPSDSVPLCRFLSFRVNLNNRSKQRIWV